MKAFLHELIASHGPLPVDRYMALCLGHPKFGYYMTRDPLGAAGDFTTAPEINQVFGELLGIWCVATWEAIGKPTPFALMEMGPGRGTLMADMLRATSKMTDFQKALEVHLVETSPVLRTVQAESLNAFEPIWHDTVESLPELPMIFVANEFFDALPVRQLLHREARNFERHIVAEKQKLAFGDIPTPDFGALHDGIYEYAAASRSIGQALGQRIAAFGGAGVVIDYGYLKPGTGDTLQAVKAHTPCGALEYPGESDLTTHVDFAALAEAFQAGGADVLAPQTQGSFLKAMGLEERVLALATNLTGQEQTDFISGAKRLVDDNEMGQLFKVLCIVQKSRNPIYPFEAA